MRKRDDTEIRGVAEAGTLTLSALVRRYENEIIRQALLTSQGSVTKAALLLGVSHQRLIYILKSRHKDLLSVRTPAKQRKRSIIAKREAKRFRRAQSSEPS